jgi:Acetyltransferase (GNAT) family
MVESFPIEKERELQFFPATERDKQAFAEWAGSFRRPGNPKVLDALELWTLAFRRWREAQVKRRVAESIGEVLDFIQDNPHAEVVHVVVVRAPWLQDDTLVGICHLRRTWCNNIFIDYVTVHPRLIMIRSVRGIGTALLYYATSFAEAVGASVIWGEATQNSVGFYKKVFGKPDMQDLIYIDKSDYLEFKSSIERMFNIPSRT